LQVEGATLNHDDADDVVDVFFRNKVQNAWVLFARIFVSILLLLIIK